MRDLNKTMLIGNLTRDPELRTIPSGQTVASFSVATNRSWNDASGELQKAVEYTDIVAWGKLAEIAGQILKKGRKTFVEGRLQTRNWEGQDGIKRYKTEVIASDIIVLDRPAGIGGFDQNNQQTETVETTAPETVPAATDNTSSTPIPNNNQEIDIEDIPF